MAVSGHREGRPQLNALMAAARNHEIDCVLVWKFDRFTCSTRHLLTARDYFLHVSRTYPMPGYPEEPGSPLEAKNPHVAAILTAFDVVMLRSWRRVAG